jgi:hypothetical protein
MPKKKDRQSINDQGDALVTAAWKDVELLLKAPSFKKFDNKKISVSHPPPIPNFEDICDMDEFKRLENEPYFVMEGLESQRWRGDHPVLGPVHFYRQKNTEKVISIFQSVNRGFMNGHYLEYWPDGSLHIMGEHRYPKRDSEGKPFIPVEHLLHGKYQLFNKKGVKKYENLYEYGKQTGTAFRLGQTD